MIFCRQIEVIPKNHVVKVFSDRKIRVTAKDLLRNSSIYASWLYQHGYSIVGIHMGNCPEFLYLFLGAMRAGVRVRLYNALKEATDPIPILDRDSAAAIIQKHTKPLCDFTEYNWSNNEPLVEMSTSGTSGTPKIIKKSLSNFWGKRGINAYYKTLTKMLGLRLYNSSPWYHNTGLYILMCIFCGLSFTEITSEKFNPNNMRKYINALRPNIVITTPSMMVRSALSGETHLPSYMIFTGEALSVETIKLLSTFTGGQFLFSSYGSTEVEGISNFLYAFESINVLNRLILRILNRFVVRGKIIDKNTLKPNFAGTIRKNVRVKIVDNNKAVKDGEIGEIWVHTPLMIDELKEKYFHTGDLGYKIGDHLYICGRHLNVINRSGEKIIPYEIQKAISGFEGVRSVLVFGIPSVSYGEDICVVIESRNGERVIEKEMLYDVLPKYMVPQHILFLDSIPLNGSGKEDMSAIYKYAIGEIGTDGNCGT